MKAALKKVIPKGALERFRSFQRNRERARIASLPPLDEEAFKAILTKELGLKRGDCVLVHSSIDSLHLAFPFFKILPLISEVIGPEGTQVYPTYPRLGSYEFLSSGEIFDVRRTPSFTGALTELARRHKGALRSLHPTKSVCAIGPLASTLVSDHHQGLFPYGPQSPYAKLANANGKIIGLGVTSAHLSNVHCVEDFLGKDFPVRVYHDQVFEARCLNETGQEVLIKTYAHDKLKLRHNIGPYLKQNVERVVAEDLQIRGFPFFRAQAGPLHQRMIDLARRNITIYPRRLQVK
jgi:aminoglycoside 3-N-acetyltransferase